jgi:hypothetical protein
MAYVSKFAKTDFLEQKKGLWAHDMAGMAQDEEGLHDRSFRLWAYEAVKSCLAGSIVD